MNALQTALITGASSGLGAEFARQFAARGYHLILVARREELLQQLAAELQQQHRITCEVLLADLSQRSGIEKVEKHIASLTRIDLLVNNAGFGTYGLFNEVAAARHEDMINVHILATVRLCRAALPKMVEQGSGGIINVSSVAAFLPMIGNVNYSASKAYLVTFSEALHSEWKERGIKVQALCPGFTYTGFHDTPEYSGFDRNEVPRSWWMRAETVVATSLRNLAHGAPICVPGLRYRLFVMLGKNRAVLSLISFLRRKRQAKLK